MYNIFPVMIFICIIDIVFIIILLIIIIILRYIITFTILITILITITIIIINIIIIIWLIAFNQFLTMTWTYSCWRLSYIQLLTFYVLSFIHFINLIVQSIHFFPRKFNPYPLIIIYFNYQTLLFFYYFIILWFYYYNILSS